MCRERADFSIPNKLYRAKAAKWAKGNSNSFATFADFARHFFHSDFNDRFVGRRQSSLLAFSQSNNGNRASSPRWQVFQNGNEFDNECGQQQNVKANRPTRQRHRDTINGLIAENPAERAEEKLQSIGKYCHGKCENNSRARQFWRAKHPFQPVGQFHLLDELKPISLPIPRLFL
jgi:hypothetical protein